MNCAFLQTRHSLTAKTAEIDKPSECVFLQIHGKVTAKTAEIGQQTECVFLQTRHHRTAKTAEMGMDGIAFSTRTPEANRQNRQNPYFGSFGS